jgi:hypothetical protein
LLKSANAQLCRTAIFFRRDRSVRVSVGSFTFDTIRVVLTMFVAFHEQTFWPDCGSRFVRTFSFNSGPITHAVQLAQPI